MPSFIRTLGVAVAAAGIVLTTVVGPAVAFDPVPGARYKGKVTDGWQYASVVRFRVSDDGNWVRGMYVGPYPAGIECPYYDYGAPPDQSTRRAAVKKGRRGWSAWSFTARVTYRSETGELLARSYVKGRFGRNGHEHGIIRTAIFDRYSCFDDIYPDRRFANYRTTVQ